MVVKGSEKPGTFTTRNPMPVIDKNLIGGLGAETCSGGLLGR